MPPENPRTNSPARSVSWKRSSSSGGATGALGRGDAIIGAMKHQDLASGQREIQIRALLHDADQALGFDLLAPDVMFADPRLAARGPHARGQDSEGGGLAGAVGAQKSEDLSRFHFEREAVQGDNLEILLLLGTARSRHGKSRRAGSHGGRR